MSTKETTGQRSRPEAHESLGRTAAWLAKQVELGLSAVDLTLPQYRVLGMLDGISAVSSEMAQRLAVRPPTVTAVVEGLVQRGLVQRGTVEGDRRQVAHVLTERGRQVLEDADRSVDARLVEIAGHLDGAGQPEQAIVGLSLWRRAMVASHRAVSTR